MFQWLFLDEKDISPAEATRWRLSALRIILVSGFLLEALIAIHSSIDAIAIGAYHVVVIVAVFYAMITLGLYFSAKRPDLGASVLIVTVYAAGGAILFFINVDEIAKLGIIFVYTTPIIARLFFGVRLAMGLMLLNFVPFFYLLRNGPFVHFDALNITLAASHGYIHSLLFLFFNVCVPLAVFRVLHALDVSIVRYRQASWSLVQSHAQYREFFENASGPVVLCGDNGEVLQANQRALELTGLRSGEVEGKSFVGFVCRFSGESNRSVALPEFVGKQFLGRAGKWISIQDVSRTSQGRFVIVLHDTSRLLQVSQELLQSREREEFLSNYDALTRLPNREMLQRHLGDVLESLEPNRVVSLVSFRLNSVRHANEKFGISTGDRFIKRFAEALRAALPERTFCARLRSVVFAIVLPPISTASEVVGQVESLRRALPSEMQIDGNDVFVQLSTGIVLARQTDISPDELIRRSEVALDSARRSSDKSAALFDEGDAAAIRRNIEVELGIVSALRNREFRMVYQPKVTENQCLSGLEALVRWHSPILGHVSPGEFIPVAEGCGLIHDITRAILDEVCAFIRRTLDRGFPCPPVAINLSAFDIVRPDLLESIENATRRHGVPFHRLDFEITETGLIGNEALAIRHLTEIGRRGSSIFIDDFGTGYSSLSKLSSFPVNGIKIDQSFVARIGCCRKSELIVKSIVALADMMSCTTIAEGVESKTQMEFLQTIGCGIFQGFYFHRPLEEQQLDSLLRQS